MEMDGTTVSNGEGSRSMAEVPDSLDGVLRQIWSSIARGVKDRRHGFHSPAVATQGPNGPDIRTVVLRDCRESLRRVTFHTDMRSAKVAALRQFCGVAWLFYDPARKTQIRLSGRATVHHGDARAAEGWARTRDFSRRCYCIPVAPGSAVAGPSGGLPEGMETRAPTTEESERLGWPHFAVVDTVADRLDWLWLAHDGHRRAGFTWADGTWRGAWLIP